MLGLFRPLLMEFPDSCLGRYLFNTNENGYFFVRNEFNVESNVAFTLQIRQLMKAWPWTCLDPEFWPPAVAIWAGKEAA